MFGYFIILFLFCLHGVSCTFKSWSLLAEIRMPDGVEYAKSQYVISGRGFRTLISGYNDLIADEYGIAVHTTDDGVDVPGGGTWSQQATLKADPVRSSDLFGSWIRGRNQTIIVGAPESKESNVASAGAVYIFNGTRRYWTQLQKLVASDGGEFSRFGASTIFHNNRLLVGAPGSFEKEGAAYIFERAYEGALWSRKEILRARDANPDIVTPANLLAATPTNGSIVNGSLFAETMALFGDTVVCSSRSDELIGQTTGSAYVFRTESGRWSQQQKLLTFDFEHDIYFWLTPSKYDEGRRVFSNDLAMTESSLAVGIRRTDETELIQQSVYMYASNGAELGNTRWSLQQKLIMDNNTEEDAALPRMETTGGKVYFGDDEMSLFATLTGEKNVTYVFQTDTTDANGAILGAGSRYWSQQQRLTPFVEPNGSTASKFDLPSQFGSTLLMSSNDNTIEMLSQLHNGSCLLLWMSDHFGEGWDSLVLTVRAPDVTNDSFSPKCDQVDPFYVRYCPYDPDDSGVYIVKPYAAKSSRFFWEVSWKVFVESTGITYFGDYSTKMKFYFNSTSLEFSFVESENEVIIENREVQPCYRCRAVQTRSWRELQIVGQTSFWPFTAIGGPYYISDASGRNVFFSGAVCDSIQEYECYQTLSTGVYIMRMGGGLFGRQLKFPKYFARWHGCGRNGTWKDQFTFRIEDGLCEPIQVFRYNTTCAVPDGLTNIGPDPAFPLLIDNSTTSRRLEPSDQKAMDDMWMF